MARRNAIWGIDIGICAIKALRCVPGSAPGELVADRFDFIEFPKMLNQPEVDVDGQIQEALQQFLSRNEVKGDRVAVSVPGQSGLSRFFRPPPVDLKTLPDIVKYEVKQQIPFPIEDVIWDWQKLGGVEVDGRIIDAEVGLFAMKRDGVFRALKPFNDAGIDVDVVQLSPLAVFNFAVNELIRKNPADDDGENKSKSWVVLSIGTDTTDLIVTNGSRLWLRNIPVGGNHFTKQLSRELKLTHAKAEQLKKNVRQAEDPKQLLTAMRPVFNDLVNEVQRSITFFRSIDKTADIGQMVLLGNAAQLPGLRQYLGSQLEIDIAKVDEFQRLKGPEVVQQGPFQENLLSFAPAYGLCLQGIGQSQLKTNLLPREIQVERIIEAKKPWVLAAASFLLGGAALGLLFSASQWFRVSDSYTLNGIAWKDSFSEVERRASRSKALVATDDEQKTVLNNIKTISTELTSSSLDKTTWIELYEAIEQALPKDPRITDRAVDPKNIPFADREVIYVDSIESGFLADMASWEAMVQPLQAGMVLAQDGPAAADSGSAATPPAAATDPAAGAVPPATLTGPGWVVELQAHHYHNSVRMMQEADSSRQFVIRTLINNLKNSDVTLPGDEAAGGGVFKYSDLGVFLPTIVWTMETPEDFTITLKTDRPAGGAGGDSAQGGSRSGGLSLGGTMGNTGAEPAPADPKTFKAPRYDFIVQFGWQPRNAQERIAARAERLKKEEAAAAAAAVAAGAATPETTE